MNRLYAFNGGDCWIITNQPVGDLFDAIRDGPYVGTSFGRQPPTTWEITPWEAVPVVVLGNQKGRAA